MFLNQFYYQLHIVRCVSFKKIQIQVGAVWSQYFKIIEVKNIEINFIFNL